MAVVVHELDVPRRNNCCSAEFACPHFTLEHDNPVLFLQPQVRKFHISYVIYRCLAALYFIIIFIYNVSTYEHGAKYLIFISNWSYITLTLHLVILALTSTTSYLKFKREAGYATSACNSHMHGYLKLSWALFNIATNSALCMMVLYWILVYRAETTKLNITTVTAHLLNAMVVLVDLFVVAIPVRLLHMYIPMVYATVYLIFAPIYWAAGGSNTADEYNHICSPMEYTNIPEVAAAESIAIVVLVIPLMHSVVFCLYKLRLCIYGVAGVEYILQNQTQQQDVLPQQASVAVNAKERAAFDHTPIIV